MRLSSDQQASNTSLPLAQAREVTAEQDSMQIMANELVTIEHHVRVTKLLKDWPVRSYSVLRLLS